MMFSDTNFGNLGLKNTIPVTRPGFYHHSDTSHSKVGYKDRGWINEDTLSLCVRMTNTFIMDFSRTCKAVFVNFLNQSTNL